MWRETLLWFGVVLVLLQPSSVVGDKAKAQPLYNGNSVEEFLTSCIKKPPPAVDECKINAGTDYARLHAARKNIRSSIEWQANVPRFVVTITGIAISTCLMIHLIIVRHFDLRYLPIINKLFDADPSEDKTDGVKYDQFKWMDYLVLDGNHPAFRHRDWGSVQWVKYVKEKFDWQQFKAMDKHTLDSLEAQWKQEWRFLSKKELAEHLQDDEEKEGAEETLLGAARDEF